MKKLTDMQRAMLLKINKEPLWAYGLQLGSCKSLVKLGLAKADTDRFYSITPAGQKKAAELLATTLVISETETGTYHYHLREANDDPKTALCGAKLGWDTQMTMAAWGTKDGYSRWCEKCQTIKEERDP